MAQQQKLAKGGKNVARGMRQRAQTIAARADKVKHSRAVHESNALHCCGRAFATKLHTFYIQNVAGKKHGHKRAKKFQS